MLSKQNQKLFFKIKPLLKINKLKYIYRMYT